MNLNTEIKIKKALEYAFSSVNAKDDLEHEAKMIMYRFLSEVERISDVEDINRKELAILIGTSASYITQLFRGNKLINMETIAKFQKVFDVTFEIKALPNNAVDAFKDMNMSELFENQENTQGFWAYHKFNPVYNDKPGQEINQGDKYERRSA